MGQIKVAMVGFRGLPGVQGGVETHVENLCPLLAERGYEVHVLTRSSYQPTLPGSKWNGVHVHRLWAPKIRSLEAIVHTFLGVIRAAVLGAEVVHIHAVGPAIVVPLARLLGLKVVVTHHGPDYERQKWGGMAKSVLKLGERLGMRYAHARIAISPVIRDLVHVKYNRECSVIPNGVLLPKLALTDAALRSFNLESGKYILLVSRLVPEKRHLDLIEAYRRASLSEWKLVLVGSADHPDAYSEKVQEVGKATPGVVMAGFCTGQILAELYTNAGLFVLPSSHEGLPIALLEALSYGLAVLASDIAANKAVGLDGDCYFRLGDIGQLANKLVERKNVLLGEHERELRRRWVSERYSWPEIASQTVTIYESILNDRRA